MLSANGGVSTTTLTTSGDASVGGTLNMNGNKITGVANGTAPGDAVNFGQLQDTRKMLSGGIASAAAMSNIPLVETNKQFAVGVGLGGYDGQSAIAFGASVRANPSTVFRASIAGGSASKTTVGAGMSFSW
jgi:autotransporter adhesin